MAKRILSAVLLWLVAVGAFVAVNDTPATASQETPAPQAAPTRVAEQRSEPLPPVVAQMRQLEHRARVAMILYPGRLDRGSLASNQKQRPVVAFSAAAPLAKK